jgi:hypothetical protein
MRFSRLTQRFRVVKKLLDGALGPDARPLEIRAAVVDAVEDQVETLGVGRRAFPYRQIVVRLLAPETGHKAALERVFADLEEKVRARLREVRCEVAPGLVCRVTFIKRAPTAWAPGQLFAIDYGARGDGESEAAAPPSAIPQIRLTVLKGTATKKTYVFAESTILLGRTPEVTDSHGRTRRNHVAFADDNSSVSRAHAKVSFDKARREYRLLDNGSARGSWIVRGGTAIPVLRDPRGVRIQSGDEIQLGEASVRVVID